MHYNTKNFIASLPYKLTPGQADAVRQICEDLAKNRKSKGAWNMNRVIQGDVGSGKTAVAACAIVEAISQTDDAQALYMTPTENLATQQGRYIEQTLGPAGVTTQTVTSKGANKTNKAKLLSISEGGVDVITGTHAILNEKIRPPNATLVIIDEQQKFGVAHRACAGLKATKPNILILTATPIPRTAAHMLMGRIDTTVIPHKPAGRKPIKTISILGADKKANDAKVNKAIRGAIAAKGKTFIIYAAIEKDKSMGGALRALEDDVKRVVKQLKRPVAKLHRLMSKEDREAAMQEFAFGKTDILCATSAVEVGVDVPEATTIVVYNSEQFGISQLHQLRGRVGRNSKQAYCLLVNEKVPKKTEGKGKAGKGKAGKGKAGKGKAGKGRTGDEDDDEDGGDGEPEPEPKDRQRIQDLVDSQDGELLALKDLERRGPGEVDGLVQKGWIEEADKKRKREADAKTARTGQPHSPYEGESFRGKPRGNQATPSSDEGRYSDEGPKRTRTY